MISPMTEKRSFTDNQIEKWSRLGPSEKGPISETGTQIHLQQWNLMNLDHFDSDPGSDPTCTHLPKSWICGFNDRRPDGLSSWRFLLPQKTYCHRKVCTRKLDLWNFQEVPGVTGMSGRIENGRSGFWWSLKRLLATTILKTTFADWGGNLRLGKHLVEKGPDKVRCNRRLSTVSDIIQLNNIHAIKLLHYCTNRTFLDSIVTGLIQSK